MDGREDTKTICTFSNNFPGYLQHTQIDYKFHLYAANYRTEQQSITELVGC